MTRELVDRRVLADERQIAFAVAWPAIEALLRRAQQRRLTEAERAESAAEKLESERVHLLERAALPGITPFHRAIHRHDVRCDLRRLRQRVMALGQQQLAKELRVSAARRRETMQAAR